MRRYLRCSIFSYSALNCESQGRVYHRLVPLRTPTCVDPVPYLEGDPVGDSDGCMCVTGLLESGDKCIAPSQCGCEIDDKYYPVREYDLSFSLSIMRIPVLNNQSCSTFSDPLFWPSCPFNADINLCITCSVNTLLIIKYEFILLVMS